MLAVRLVGGSLTGEKFSSKKLNVQSVFCVQLKYLDLKMQLGQHLILPLAGHRKPHERMIDYFLPVFGMLATPGTQRCGDTSVPYALVL